MRPKTAATAVRSGSVRSVAACSRIVRTAHAAPAAKNAISAASGSGESRPEDSAA